jgi:nucleotide-binding universal stress UspA family protein
VTPTEPAAAADPSSTMLGYTSVLVPLDGSDLAARALGTARWLADRLGAGVHLVSAATTPGSRDAHVAAIESQQARVPGATLHLSEAADAGAAIVSLVRDLDPCLVCMSTHGRSRTAALLGSTTVRVATELAAPLVAVGSRVRAASRSADRVVVTLDGWAAAERAIAPAAAWAQRLGVGLSLVTSADPLLVSQEDGSRHGDHYGPSHDPQTYLSDLAARPGLALLPVDVQVLWSSAAPHVSLGAHLDTHPASLVVATSHIRRRLARLALGSKAAKLIHRSPAPVLLLPGGG